MFWFVTRYLNFFKHVPGVAFLFDSWLKAWTAISKPALLDWIDEIEGEVLKWEHTRTSFHKYGGLQFNCNNKEIGHIHSNGLLDMLLSRKIKEQLIAEGCIKDHHIFKNTGWISFYINTVNDKDYAIKLLKLAYYNKINLFAPGGNNQIPFSAIIAVFA